MTAPEIGNYGIAPTMTASRARRRSPASSSATNRRSPATGARDGTLRDYLVAPQHRRHLRHRHARADARAAVGRRDARRHRHRRRTIRASWSRRRGRCRRWKARTSCVGVTCDAPFDWTPEPSDEFAPPPQRRAGRPLRGRRLRLRHEVEHPAALHRARLRRARVPGDDAGRPSCWRRSPTACS